MIELVCAQCGCRFAKAVGQANRQRRVCGPRVRFFCTRRCHADSRRLDVPKAERAANKAACDRQYRAKNLDRIKASKREWHQRTYDPEAAREHRKARAAEHRAYLAIYTATPEWKAHKAEYDRELRAAEFGDFAEAHALLVDLERAVRVQPWYERAKERGYYDNDRQPQQRKRNEQISRW